jgi:hypothetical protein
VLRSRELLVKTRGSLENHLRDIQAFGLTIGTVAIGQSDVPGQNLDRRFREGGSARA